MAGWIKMPLGTKVGFGEGHIVLDGDLAPPPQKVHSPQFSARLFWSNGRPSQLLLTSCCCLFEWKSKLNNLQRLHWRTLYQAQLKCLRLDSCGWEAWEGLLATLIKLLTGEVWQVISMTSATIANM